VRVRVTVPWGPLKKPMIDVYLKRTNLAPFTHFLLNYLRH
jgi:hypothetical protein